MARKDRVPNPPKRPQAPQRRSTPSGPVDAERRRRIIYATVGSAIVALAVVLGIVLLRGSGGGGAESVPAALRSAGCTYREFPAQERGHTSVLTEKIKWNSSPPTNGRHFEAPAVWGAYDEPLLLTQMVHNLEHGGVYVLYGPKVDPGTIEELRSFYGEDPTGMLLAPLPSLGNQIALGVWTTPDGDPEKGTGRLAFCRTYNKGAFEEFRDAYRFTGPERFPPDSLQPGS